LVDYFLQKHGPSLGASAPSIHPQAVAFLQDQPWPGNVRELENILRKALLLAQNYTVNLEHVRAALNQNSSAALAGSFGDYVDALLAAAQRGELADVHARGLETAERELIARAIAQAQGNQTKAARWLGITRVTMKSKLVQFGLRGENLD
jgi:DNA-binding NtrC family response regulator